jgi:hypothetical protein
MTDQLRRLLGELADEAPTSVEPAAVRRSAARRRATGVTAVAALAVAGAATAAAVLQPADRRDSLGPAEGEPTPVASSTSSPTPMPAPVRSLPPAGPRPEVVYAATGSRVARYRVADGTREAWLSPEEAGKGAGDLALSRTQVLYGLGGDGTRDVRVVVHPPRDGSGPGVLSDPGGFFPAVLPDGSRYAFFATGDDAAYTPRSPEDLRLVLHTADGGGVQAAILRPEDLVSGLAFAGPDRLVTTVRGASGSALRVYDFQTDEAGLGSRAPDEQQFSAPDGCDWSLATAAPDADQVLVLERCRTSGGPGAAIGADSSPDDLAVFVDVTSGARVAELGVVRPAGPGQVDSLDLDSTGRHLVAQVHDGGVPPSPGTQVEPTGPAFTTRTLPSGSTVTTTSSLVSPVWD